MVRWGTAGGRKAMGKMINGVDVDRLVGTIEAIRADAKVAGFQFRLTNKWAGGGENRSTIEGFHGANQEIRHAQSFDVTNDETPVLLGNDRAPNPVEHVLSALAGCLTTSLVYHAAARGIVVKGVATRLEGDLDLRGFLGISETTRRGFQTIRVAFDIDGDLTAAQKNELIGLAQKYSPVFDIVSNGVPVDVRVAGANGKTRSAA
jgi:uncharacterized OsmC-like protein